MRGNHVRRIILCGLCLCAFFLSGCSYNQTLKDSWKYTSRQYRSYLNTPASLDMDDTGSCEVYELALGESVMEVDGQLRNLIRAMENSDQSPDQNWVMGIMRRFPWLSGVALADPEGKPIARYPEYFMKEFDVTPLLTADPKQRIGSLRAYVQQTPLGPEVYLANPVYVGEELRGLIVAYFDPRALVSLSSDPGSFMLASSSGVLWAGRFSAEATAVGQEEWDKVLLNKSCGTIGGSGHEFFWTTRYLGNLPIVYAIPTDAGDVKESDKSMQELRRVDMSDAPPMKLDPSLSEGEVGNVGAPNVTPSNAPGASANPDAKKPLNQ